MNKRRSFFRRVIRGLTVLALIAVVLVVMLTLPSAWRLRRLVFERDALLAQLDRDEPGWRWEDLVPAKVPDEQNGALKVLEIAKLIPKDWLNMPDEVSDLRPRNTHLFPRVTFPNEYIAHIEQGLKRLTPARARFKELIGLTAGNYGWDHATEGKKDGVLQATWSGKAIPTLNDALQVYRVLRLEFDWLLSTGQGDQAADNLCAQIGYVRTWNSYPTIIESAGFRSRFYGALNEHSLRFLAQSIASPDALRRLSLKLESLKPDLHENWLVTSERAFLYRFLEEGLSRANWPYEAKFMSDYDIDVESDVGWLDEWLRKVPFRRAGSREAKIQEQVNVLRFFRQAGTSPLDLKNAIDRWCDTLDGPQGRELKKCAPWFNNFVIVVWRKALSDILGTETDINRARIAIACELYRQVHGSWPEDYKQLSSLPDASTLLPPAIYAPAGLKKMPDGLVLYWSEPKDPKNIEVLTKVDEQGNYIFAPDRGIRLWDPDKRKP
jgi:hypothetical protein